MAQDPVPENTSYRKPEDEGTIISQGIFSNASAGRRGREHSEIRIGDTIKDRFVIEDLLGSGGMGTVYLAVDLRKQELSDRNAHVAIKVLKEGLRDHQLSIMAMQREARKAQELAHPNIIKVYDFDKDKDKHYITMEYLVGQSLDHVLRDPKFKPKTVEEILPILKQVADALSFAHANGFVHCDLKPGNIFITQSGRVKVIDFGIARAIKSGLAGAEDATVFSTKELAALTPAFASPQMIELLDPEPNDDIYALACIVYELLSGQHPYRRVPANHARDSGMKPKRLNGLTNSQWQALVHALAFGSKERTPSVTAFMEEFTGGETIGAGKFGKLGKLAALCAASVAIGFGVVLLTSKGLTPPVSSPQVQTSISQPPVAQVPVVQPPAPQVPSAKPLPPTVQRSVQIETPGAAEAVAAFGSWCGDSFKIMLGPAEGVLTLPSATELRLKVERYQMFAGRLAVYTLATDGGRSIWEFSDFSADGKSMIHLRQRNGDGDWRTYNRRLRRC